MRRGLIVAGVLALIAAPVLLWWWLKPSEVTPPASGPVTSAEPAKRSPAPPRATADAPVAPGSDQDAGTGTFGWVVDENGDPVPNAHVQLEGDTDRDTDDAGRYRVDYEQPTELHVLAFDAAHGFGTADGSSAAPPTVTLSPLGALRVRVTVGGRPAAKAEITLCQTRDGAGKPAPRRPPCDVTLITGPGGVMSSKGLNAGDWTVAVNAEEAGELANTVVSLEGAGVRELSFELREARRFEGLVTDLNGKPIHCARVTVLGRSVQSRQAGAVGYIEAGEGYAFSDEKGHFLLRLEPDRTTARLTVEHRGFELADDEYDQSTNLRVRLKPFPHYRGLVVGPGDKPVDEFWVNGRHAKGGRFEVAVERPDDDGTIPIDINAGGYRYLSETRLARPDLGVFHLEPLTVVSGTVFGSDGGIVAAQVSVSPAQPWTSAADGHFKIELDPGDVPESGLTIRAVGGEECTEKPLELANAEGLVLRLAPGECPMVEPPADEYGGPPPEAFEPECTDDEDE